MSPECHGIHHSAKNFLVTVWHNDQITVAWGQLHLLFCCYSIKLYGASKAFVYNADQFAVFQLRAQFVIWPIEFSKGLGD